MMIVEIDLPTFPLITFIIRGKSRKMKVSQSLLEESRKRSGLGELASHANVLRDSSRVPGGTRDDPPENVCVGG